VQIHTLHSWDLSILDAIALQKQLAKQIDVQRPLKRCKLVAGADVSYALGSNVFYAVVVVMRAEDCHIVEVQKAVAKSPFPYVPGLLSFREAPILLQAFAHVETKVDAVMFDGQGTAHQRRLGIASHMGLWLQVPCVGCAKSRLLGRYEAPDWKAGSTSPLKDKDEVIGTVVRTKNKVNPLFISAGHLIDLECSVQLTLRMCRGYRLPETTRQAHLHVNALRREHSE
jgi:deoxyribonuclease V